MNIFRKKISIALLLPILVLVVASCVLYSVHAFNGPTSGGGSGSGAIGVNTANSVSIGTSTPPPANVKFYVVASSTGDTGNYAFQVVDSSANPLFVVRNDGSIAIGTTTQNGAGTLTVSGNIYAPDINLVPTVPAAYVTAGQPFGSAGVGGNFSFPANLSVSSSLTVANGLTVSGGSVGIGTASPLGNLEISGASPGLITYNTNGGTNDKYYYLSNNSNNFNVSWGNDAFNGWGTIAAFYNNGGMSVGGTYAANNAPPTNGMIVQGNVGIGTTGPTANLQIVGTSVPTLTGGATAGVLITDQTLSGTEMAMGADINHSPYEGWIQVRHASNGTAYPLALNPLGGNIGIATTSPAYQLDVNGTARATTLIDSGLTSQTCLGTNSSGQLQAGTCGGSSQWTTSGSNIYYNLGSVGIGTATPGSLLNLSAVAPGLETSPSGYGGTNYATYVGSESSAQGVLQLGNNGQNYIVAGNTAAGGYLSFVVNNTNTFPSVPNGTTAMAITSAGNVGIGVASPAQKLDVNGSVGIDAGSSLVFNDDASAENIGASWGLKMNGDTSHPVYVPNSSLFGRI